MRNPVQRAPASCGVSRGLRKASRLTLVSVRLPWRLSRVAESTQEIVMFRAIRFFLPLLFLAVATFAVAQDGYKVITVTDGGTISGTVKWSGPVPRELDFPVTKDPQVCDPDGKKTTSLERLIVGS